MDFCKSGLIIAGLVVGLFLVECGASEQPSQGLARADRPNVIFIKTDDQRADYLGCMGHPVIKTPNIDRLAAQGVLFENAFVTSAACTPSRTCFFTGRWERNHGVNFNSDSAITVGAFAQSWPMVLKRAGYFTGYVGKNHVPVGEGGYEGGSIEKAFDYWYGNHRHSYFYPKRPHPIYRNAAADTQIEIFEEGAMNFLSPNDKFLSGAKEFLQRRPTDKPFCLSVNFNVPHGAGTSSMKLLPKDPALYRTAYRDVIDQIPVPPTYLAEKDIKTPKIPRHVYNGKYISSYNYVKELATLQERQVRTCQTITGVDRLVGHLVDELERLGLADNTIIIFSSDHGLLHGEHGLGGKCLLYEKAIHIPLIIYDPRLPVSQRGQRIREFALSVDVAPTILLRCGVEIPSPVQGKSLWPLILGEKVEWRQDFFCENLLTRQNYPRVEAVRSHEWKYIRYFRRGDPIEAYADTLEASIRGEEPIYEELYHLTKDPHEEHNVAGDPGYSDTLEQYRQRIRKLVVEAKGGSGPPPTIPYFWKRR